ncbi:MAG: hypothetical protein U1E22_07885, partial [Coriobacteriia bacterium]|nr:hypothetical protein [Coriobacteriia bacterium]
VDELMLQEGTELDIVVHEDSVMMEPVAGTWDAMCERMRQQAKARGITDEDVTPAVDDERYGKSSE